MITLTPEFILETVKHDFEQVLENNPSLLEIKEPLVFVEKFVNDWMKLCQLTYTWYNHLFYELSHSYRKLFLLGEYLENRYYEVQSLQKTSNVISLIR